MKSVTLPSSVILKLPSCQYFPPHRVQNQNISSKSDSFRGPCISSFSVPFPSNSHRSRLGRQSYVGAKDPLNEGPLTMMDFEDFLEKDWSFLDSHELSSKEEHDQKVNRIISAGGIEESSRVLVSLGSEGFVDQLVNTSPCSRLLLVHDSLFLLACIKEKYDNVKCWQGELIHVPEKWAPFDVLYLYFLPALPFKLDQVFKTLAKRCSPGARLVISLPLGREVLEQQRKQYQDVIVSDLPNKTTLQEVAADHFFEMAEFIEEPGFYLAVLRFSGAKV